jgi:hypothetical protein
VWLVSGFIVGSTAHFPKALVRTGFYLWVRSLRRLTLTECSMVGLRPHRGVVRMPSFTQRAASRVCLCPTRWLCAIVYTLPVTLNHRCDICLLAPLSNILGVYPGRLKSTVGVTFVCCLFFQM